MGGAVWALGCLLALKFGAVSHLESEWVIELRLPRIILASSVGMGLAVAGAALQALFSNPLCEPYTTGISSGSALGAVLGSIFALEFSVSGLAGSAFVGALIFSGILYIFSYRSGRSGEGSVTLLLTGVMLGFLGSSLVALSIAMTDQNGIQGVLFWLLGDLSRARLSGALFSFGLISIFSVQVYGGWRSLDGMLMGEQHALTLGVPVDKVRRRVIVLTSLLTAMCVSAAGMIGFVGLVVPHFVRQYSGSLHRRLIPLSAIWGAATLVYADLLARLILRPSELPVGVVTAMVGAPVFMWIMLRRRKAAE